MENKHHYRNVLKSDHLGIADLEDMVEQGKRLVFTIKEVKQYTLVEGKKDSGIVVAGKRISANIAYFKEDIKPLVVNATNGKILRSFAKDHSPMVEDWAGLVIELYIDPNVKMKGDIVGGIRIKPAQPTATKPELTPNMPEWKKAVEWLKGEGNIPGIKKRYNLSEANEQLLKDAAL